VAIGFPISRDPPEGGTRDGVLARYQLSS